MIKKYVILCGMFFFFMSPLLAKKTEVMVFRVSEVKYEYFQKEASEILRRGRQYENSPAIDSPSGYANKNWKNAFECYQKAASFGCEEAETAMVRSQIYGIGTPILKNKNKAYEVLKKNSSWHSEAVTTLSEEILFSKSYWVGENIPGMGEIASSLSDFENKKFDIFITSQLKQAAERGDFTAQIDYGIYLRKYGDTQEAEKYFSTGFPLLKEKSENSIYALYLLAHCYHGGFGTTPDADATLDCCRRAARQGMPDMQLSYGMSFMAPFGSNPYTFGSIACNFGYDSKTKKFVKSIRYNMYCYELEDLEKENFINKNSKDLNLDLIFGSAPKSDLTQAQYWLEKAVEQNKNEDAMIWLLLLSSNTPEIDEKDINRIIQKYHIDIAKMSEQHQIVLYLAQKKEKECMAMLEKRFQKNELQSISPMVFYLLQKDLEESLAFLDDLIRKGNKLAELTKGFLYLHSPKYEKKGLEILERIRMRGLMETYVSC